MSYDYRKKPVVIQAVRNDGTWKPIIDFLDATGHGRVPLGFRPKVDRNSDDGSLNVHTLEGVMRCDVGDWLINGVQGELYPCKPDVFEQTYEPADR